MPRRARSASTQTTPMETQTAPARGRRTPLEEGLELWSQFARETGQTASEFLRKFSEEQQKSYTVWLESFQRASRPGQAPSEGREAQARLQEWNRRTEEINARLREAMSAAMEPQRQLVDLWSRALFPMSRASNPGPSRPTPPAAPTTGAPTSSSERGTVGRRWLEQHI